MAKICPQCGSKNVYMQEYCWKCGFEFQSCYTSNFFLKLFK